MTAQNLRAILATFDLATAAEVASGSAWYPTAKAAAELIAKRYDVSIPQAVGVIAALSPRNKWERNLVDAEALVGAFTAAGPEAAAAVKVCTFTGNKRKALAILELPGLHTFADVLAILSGPKLREFASCIMGDAAEVCIDGHAFAIWQGQRVTLANVPSIGVKLRREIKADYVAAAERLGLPASTVQAVTWVTWRRIHGVG